MSIRLVAFDLDGTLIRGPNALAVMGAALGHPEWEQQMEILSMRGVSAAVMAERVAPWRRLSRTELGRASAGALLAPGVEQAFVLLHRRGVSTAIVSLAWDFHVEWFANRFGAAHWGATRLEPDGTVVPLWPEDKGPWLERLMAAEGVGRHEVTAVGDSPRDASLLQAAGHAFYVGLDRPPDLGHVRHCPHGDLSAIARAILAL
ncbi:MAG TPA: haloacid dehalogenase-like hydrolase [Methylomirabilota bacterium]|nr:haloacid dehalogenase-like hydrolase [Methylomirabilota bacterium]